jgi:uncharacterized protein DUF3175
MHLNVNFIYYEIHLPRIAQEKLMTTRTRTHTRRSRASARKWSADPFRSTMSMLTFYMNRTEKILSAGDAAKLTRAKDELRKLFHRGSNAVSEQDHSPH